MSYSLGKNEARLVSEVAAQVAPAPVLATPSPAAPHLLQQSL